LETGEKKEDSKKIEIHSNEWVKSHATIYVNPQSLKWFFLSDVLPLTLEPCLVDIPNIDSFGTACWSYLRLFSDQSIVDGLTPKT